MVFGKDKKNEYKAPRSPLKQMGFFFRGKKTKEKENQEAFEKFKNNGWVCEIILPEFETVSHGGATKAVATLAGGLIGFALVSGSKNQQRKINALVRVAEKGIVISNGTIDGKDLRIPWESIINIDLIKNWFFIKLVEGEEIRFSLGNSNYILESVQGVGNAKKFKKMILEYILPQIKGVADEGW